MRSDLDPSQNKPQPVNTSFAPAPEFFLPLAEEVAAKLAADEDTDSFFTRATISELACVLLLQNLPTLLSKQTSLTKIESIFESVIDVGRSSIPEGQPTFAQQVQQRFNSQLLMAGIAAAPQAGIALLDQDTVEAQDFLTPSGHWNRTFTSTHKCRVAPPMREIHVNGGRVVRLTDQQGRLFDDFRLGGMDESFSVQALAGAGKTFLISKFFELLDPATTLLLAYLPSQLEELKRRVQLPTNSDVLQAFTFGHIASQILNTDRSGESWRLADHQRAQTSYMVTDQQIATWLNILPVASLSAREVASLSRRAMFSFCNSASADVEAKHLPSIGGKLTQADIAMLVEFARRMWTETVTPSSPEIRLPIRNVHRIKFLAMGTGDFPAKFTHIVVDESHEMTPPMIQILDRSRQAVITLGDELQHLNGMATRRSQVVRQRHVTQSIRSGKQMGGVLNPLIQLHPGSFKEEFEGRADYPTTIIPYDGNAPIPDKPTTVIVANEWGLLNWFIRLVDAGALFYIPPSAMQDLAALLTGLVQLFREGRRANHRSLFRYESWDALAGAMGKNHAFIAAQKLMEGGFTMEQFHQVTRNFCSDPGTAIQVARVDDVKNKEFDRVILSRDLLRPPKEGLHSLATVSSMLYLAASRAKHELIIPGNLPDWANGMARKI